MQPEVTRHNNDVHYDDNWIYVGDYVYALCSEQIQNTLREQEGLMSLEVYAPKAASTCFPIVGIYPRSEGRFWGIDAAEER